MQLSTILLLCIAILIVGFLAGRQKATRIAYAIGKASRMHSLPAYHGYLVALAGAIPALLVLILYLAFSDSIIVNQIMGSLPADVRALPEAQQSLVLNDIRNLAADGIVSAKPNPAIMQAAADLNAMRATFAMLMGVVTIGIAALGCVIAFRQRSELSSLYCSRRFCFFRRFPCSISCSV
jgi:phosphate transport system permease protein